MNTMTQTRLAFADFSNEGVLELNQNELEEIDGGVLGLAFVLGYIAGIAVAGLVVWGIHELFDKDNTSSSLNPGGGGGGTMVSNSNNIY
jgi:lactobin A/cerein 7B family class IIb bacteriocin